MNQKAGSFKKTGFLKLARIGIAFMAGKSTQFAYYETGRLKACPKNTINHTRRDVTCNVSTSELDITDNDEWLITI